MRNKLIVYIAGILLDGKGGWAFAYFENKEHQELRVGFGRSNCTKDSREVAILACIAALENIKIEGNVEQVEVRMGYGSMLNVLNQISHYYYLNAELVAKRLGIQSETLATRFVQLMIYRKYQIKFKKVCYKDDYYKLACKYAEAAVNYNVLNNSNYCLRNATTQEVSLIRQNYSTEQDADFNYGLIEGRSGRPWHQNECINKLIVELNVESILLTEDVHLKTKNLNLDGILYATSNSKQLKTPIVVRKLETGGYSLVTGLKGYCTARILGIRQIAAYITDLDREDFIQSNIFKT